MTDGVPSEDDVRALERLVEAERARARRLAAVEAAQTGGIRGEARRKARRKAQRQARKHSR